MTLLKKHSLVIRIAKENAKSFDKNVVTKMKAINNNKTPEVDQSNSFDALCQGFDGGNFYGLEYILEDFFQVATAKPSVPARPAVDWFGLDN